MADIKLDALESYFSLCLWWILTSTLSSLCFFAVSTSYNVFKKLLYFRYITFRKNLEFAIKKYSVSHTKPRRNYWMKLNELEWNGKHDFVTIIYIRSFSLSYAWHFLKVYMSSEIIHTFHYQHLCHSYWYVVEKQQNAKNWLYQWISHNLIKIMRVLRLGLQKISSIIIASTIIIKFSTYIRTLLIGSDMFK